MVRRAAIAAAALAALVTGTAGQAQADPAPFQSTEPACAGMLQPGQGTTPARQPGIEDLLGLRDIGFSHQGDLDQVMKVAPDGRQIAFILSRPDPKTDSYCRLLVMVPTDGSGAVRALDSVGPPDMSRAILRGVYGSNGLPAQNVPLWSPDGSRLAYVKRTGDRSEAWLVVPATGERKRLSPPDLDVEKIAWLGDGRELAIAYRTGREEAAAALRTEGRSGYLFDDRFFTYGSNQPQRRANLPLAFRGIDLATGALRDLSEDERAPLTGKTRALDPDNWSLLTAVNGAGRRAWTALENPKEFPSQVRIWVDGKDGKPIRCEQDECIGSLAKRFINALWWSRDGSTVFWLQRTGWSNAELGLYRWKPGKPAEQISQTADMLIDCQQSVAGLFCLNESSTSPRKLVRLDTDTGKWRTVFDPNPQWSGLRLGRVERLRWRNANGFEVFGDLVLPPDYEPGKRVPLIVTQYSSRGFLRGGTGDEVPIFPFAARGYAVLSFNMPQFYSLGIPNGRWKSFDDADRVNIAEWRQRKSVLSALMAGVDLVVGKGIAAPEAVGITGLSDGTATGQHALVAHPDRFAAASMAACCLEPNLMMVYGGIALSDRYRAVGHPGARGEDLTKWKPISIALNAESVRTPLLISNGDSEALGGVESFMALREAGKAVEMYIYPDDYHLKIHAAHREALYKRNLAWFDFWLRRREDSCMASEAEYERWRKLPGAPKADQLTRSNSCKP